jgi:hypothetical protein
VGSWRRDEKGGLPPLEKGVFVGICAREKKKEKEEEEEEKKKKENRQGKEWLIQ